MAANHEIGTVQPIQEIGAIAAEFGALFHCDTAQAAGRIPIPAGAAAVACACEDSEPARSPRRYSPTKRTVRERAPVHESPVPTALTSFGRTLA
jgi:hypothetical protein